MIKELKSSEMEVIATTLVEVVTKANEHVQAPTEDLLILKEYLDSGTLQNKVRCLLTVREQQKKVEIERAAAAREAALELVRHAEMEIGGTEELTEVGKVGSWLQACPMTSELAATGDEWSDGDTTVDSNAAVVFNPSTNEGRTNFLSFITEGDEFLMLEEAQCPMSDALTQERIGYPLGVAYDEKLKDWLVCDSDNNKILLINAETNQITATDSDIIKNPSAVVIYEEGKCAAVLCSEDRKRQFAIYLYNISPKSFVRIFASFRDEKYDMRFPMRGLAKSLGNNLLSIDLIYNGPKRLRVFKKDVGAKAYEIRGTVNPSFIASHKNTVAVSDLGVNKVFIFQLDDTDWDSIHFGMTRVIESVQLSMDRLANESGFAYVSGMQFDTNGFLLIGDAKGHAIKLYDTEFVFLHRVSSNFTLPYMSSFHVNSSGEVMMLDVHANQKILWARMTSVNEIRPWVSPNGRPRRSQYASNRN